MKGILFLFLFFVQIFSGFSQDLTPKDGIPNDGFQKNMFSKEKLFGFSFNNSWTTFYNFKDPSFLKPGLGLYAEFNYFFNENMGISVQAGVQMRGTGIYTPDVGKSVGNPDSTGRLRHSLRTFEIPIVFYYRSSKEIIKNGRMIFGVGLVPLYHQKVVRKWFSVDDGFHIETSYKESFDKIDVPIRLSCGLDVNVAGGNLFRTSIIMDVGLKNNFKDPVDGTKSSKHFLLGIQLTFLL